jgi:hypothetical protein
VPDVVTLDQVKQACGVSVADPSTDLSLNDLIQVAQAEVRAITGGPLFIETITDEYVYCEDDRTLIVMQRPITSVVTIKSAWTGTVLGYSDLVPNLRSGIIRRRNWFPLYGWTDAYLVTYTAGWFSNSLGTDNPMAFSSFRQATLQIAAHIWEIWRGPTQNTNWVDDNAAPSGYSFAIPTQALEILRPYSREVYA